MKYITFLLVIIVFSSCVENVTETQKDIEQYALNQQWTDNQQLNAAIDELYISPDYLITKRLFVSSIESYPSSPRIFLSNEKGDIVAYLKEDPSSFTVDYYKFGSISPIIDANTFKTIGYVKLNSSIGLQNSGIMEYVNLDVVTEKRNSPTISELLEKDSQIILMGDSKFGLYWANLLPDMIMGLSNCVVFNCGFGGCCMSWRTEDESNPYDLFSFSSLCDAIVSQNFKKQETKMPLWSFKYSLENIKSVDFKKNTTIVVNYSTNDITESIPISIPSNVSSDTCNRHSFVGAMVYGVQKVKETYPKTRFVFLSPDYRIYNGRAIDQYVNDLGFTLEDYYMAEQNAANLLQCLFVDSYHLQFRNEETISAYTYDGTHFNGIGFSKYGQFLNSILR